MLDSIFKIISVATAAGSLVNDHREDVNRGSKEERKAARKDQWATRSQIRDIRNAATILRGILK